MEKKKLTVKRKTLIELLKYYGKEILVVVLLILGTLMCLINPKIAERLKNMYMEIRNQNEEKDNEHADRIDNDINKLMSDT